MYELLIFLCFWHRNNIQL